MTHSRPSSALTSKRESPVRRSKGVLRHPVTGRATSNLDRRAAGSR